MTRSIYLPMVLLAGCQLSTAPTGAERDSPNRRLTGPVEILDAGELLDGRELLDAGGQLLEGRDALAHELDGSECVQPLSDVCDAALVDAGDSIEQPGAWTFTEVVPRTSCSQGCSYRCAYLVVPDALDWDFYAWGLDAECGSTGRRLPFGRHGFLLKARYNRGGVGSDTHTWTVEARPRSCTPERAPPVELETTGPMVATPPHSCP